MDKTTLVIGASEKPERYAYKAIKKLRSHGHSVRALSLAPGRVDDVEFFTEPVPLEGIDTVTLYVGPRNQGAYYEYIKSLKPRRVLFNPGTENPEFQAQLESVGIQAVEACTLVLLSTDQY